ALRAEWQQAASRYQVEFPRLKGTLKKLKERYEGLQGEFDAERLLAEDPDVRHREARAREEYLRTCFLGEHKVAGVGPTREVLLASYGVETAFDVTEEQLLKIRGIGPVLRQNLLAWREAMLAGFTFDPGPPGEARRGRNDNPEVLRPLVFKY